jgi:hypothetical protein
MNICTVYLQYIYKQSSWTTIKLSRILTTNTSGRPHYLQECSTSSCTLPHELHALVRKRPAYDTGIRRFFKLSLKMSSGSSKFLSFLLLDDSWCRPLTNFLCSLSDLSSSLSDQSDSVKSHSWPTRICYPQCLLVFLVSYWSNVLVLLVPSGSKRNSQFLVRLPHSNRKTCQCWHVKIS